MDGYTEFLKMFGHEGSLSSHKYSIGRVCSSNCGKIGMRENDPPNLTSFLGGIYASYSLSLY